jgi:hypothetical protein
MDMKWSSWSNAAIALWLIASPWMLQFTDVNATRNSVLFGFLVVILGVLSAVVESGFRAFGGLNAAFGAWLAVSPWVLHLEGQSAVWNTCIAGVLILVFGIIRSTAVRRSRIVA